MRIRPVLHKKRRRGQQIVEAALVLSLVLLPALLGFLQYGVVIYTAHALNSIAREAARFSAVHGGESTFDGADTQSSPPSLKYYIKTVCATTNVHYSELLGNVGSTSTPRIQVTAAGSRVSGQGITVTLTYPMSKKSFVGAIIPGVPKEFAATGTFLLE